MVVKDTRIVKKAAPERTLLRRVCNSPRSENKLSSKAIEVLIEGSKENKPVASVSSPAPLQLPHYLLPTINSCNQTRVNAKPLSSPSVISRVRKSSQSEACTDGSRNVKGNSLSTPDVGKRMKINGLRPSAAAEKTPVKNNRLKPSVAVEKTPVKNNRFKSSGAVEKTPAENHRVKSSMAVEKIPVKNNRLKSLMAVEKTPGRASCSKIKVARTTCSSRCKHVVKDGDSKVSPKPRCPYAYCSLNHLERGDPPSVKQFLASRRRLLRTQKSFKWVGLTPVPKSVEILDDGKETESGVDTGQGLGADVLELCVEIYVNDVRGNDILVGGNDSCDNFVGGMNDLGKLSANDPRPIAYESIECDDYDDGHSMVDGSLFGSSASHEDDRIEILEREIDLSDLEVKADVSIEKLMGTEFVKDDNYGLDGMDADVSAYDVEAGYLGEYDQTEDTEDHCFIPSDAMGSQSGFDESDLGVNADDSMKEFAGVEDVKDENHRLDVGDSTHDVEANYCYEYNETEDNEGHCFILPDALGSQCNFDESDLRVKADDSMKQFAEVEVVKDDSHGLDVDASVHDVKVGETENLEDHCSILPNAMGSQCPFDELDVKVEADDSMKQFAKAEVVKDDNHGLDVYASVHDVKADKTEDGGDDSMKQFPEAEVVKDDNHGLDVYISIPEVEADETEDAEDHCFIPPNGQGPQCQFDEVDIMVQADDSMKQFAEAEAVEDDNHGLDVYVSVHDFEADETEDSEDHCFIPADAQGPQCQFHELDLRVKEDDSLKQYAEAEDVNDGNHVDDSAHDVEASHCSKYSETKDSENQCVIPPNALGSHCIGHPESDGLPGGSSLEFDSSHKGEMKEEHSTISGTLGNGSVSEVTVNDYTQQFADFEDEEDDNGGSGTQISAYESVECSGFDYTPSGDCEPCCFIQVDIFGLDHGSNTELDSPPNGSDIEPSVITKQGIEMEWMNIAGIPLIELDINISGDNLFRQFSEIEDGKGDCQSGIDVIANDSIECNTSNCSDSRDNVSHCSVQVDSPETHSTEHTESDSPVDKFFFELSASPEYEMIEDIKAASSGQSGYPFDVSVNDFEKQCTECEDCITQKVTPSSEYDDCHGTDSALCHPVREEDFTVHSNSHIESDILVDGRLVGSSSSSNDDANEDCSNIAESSLEGWVAGCESVEGDLKEYNHIAQENVNKHHVADSRLFWRRRDARPFGDQITEAEKVDLRHQMIEERRAAHEWMLDYALTQVVEKLSPFHERKVELLVEAFETVTPISKCETDDLQHDAIDFAHLRPMQACS